MRILHFADAHIDIATYGRHDPDTGLAIRTLDFLKSLDLIIDAAIQERVDLVIFAGDAYKDRTPVPTFQREWGRRMMRLSQAGSPPAAGRQPRPVSCRVGGRTPCRNTRHLRSPLHVASKPHFLETGAT